MTIKIYKPSKSSMQSGLRNSKKWLAEYIQEKDKIKDTLMGWNSSFDTKEQIKIFFETKEQAIEWAKKNNEQFIVIEPKERKIKPKNYASNFDMNRKEPWTH
jgi:GTP-binding protein EngB required for normal cell division